MKRLPHRTLTLWRVRLTLALLPAPLCVTLFFSGAPVWRAALSGAWMAAYLFFFLFYYPVKHARLTLDVNHHSLMVGCGVFYHRLKAMELQNIQHITQSASPLERALGLRTVRLWGAGGVIRVPSMAQEDARALLRRLGVREGKG